MTSVFNKKTGLLWPVGEWGYSLSENHVTVLFNANRDRLGQVLAGEMTLDEAIAKMQEDIDAGIAAAQQ